MREYAPGDSVISKCALIAPPVEPPGVRLEIPPACRGTIVDVRPYAYPYPYAVVFEVLEGVVVEIDVTQEQIVRVAPHATAVSVRPAQDMPPLVTRGPDRYVKQDGGYEPTHACPHRRCALWHIVSTLLVLANWLVFVGAEAFVGVALSMILAIALYVRHLRTGGAWNKLPEMINPGLDEELVINPRYARYAVFSDAAFATTAAALLLCHNHNFVNLGPAKVVPYAVMAAASVVLLVKVVLHSKAARIYPISEN